MRRRKEPCQLHQGDQVKKYSLMQQGNLTVEIKNTLRTRKRNLCHANSTTCKDTTEFFWNCAVNFTE